MNPTNLKHHKNNLKSKTLLAIIFSLIFTMFFLSFQCNIFNSGGSGGIFIPTPPSGPSLSNPALSIDNTKRSFSSIFDGNYYYLLGKYDAATASKLIIHRISSNFSSIFSTSFAFTLSSNDQTVSPTNILDNSSELIISADIHNLNVGTQYDSAILKINKSSLSLKQRLFFNNTEFPRIIFDNPYFYLSLRADTPSSQGYLLVLDNNFNILSQYQTDNTSTGFPDDIYLSSSSPNNLVGVLVNGNSSGIVLNTGIFIMSKSTLTSATKIPTNYIPFNTEYLRFQSPLISTESGNDYVYFADGLNSNTIYINKISVPPGVIASKQISLSSSSINNINISKINNHIIVGISKTESSIKKLLFLIFDTSLNPIQYFELDTNNNQLFMYQYQKYHETPDNGFILTGDLNPSSYKIFFLKFNNLFNLTENNIFNVVNNPTTVNITSTSYTLPTINTITLSPSSLTPSTTLYTVQSYTWTSNLSTNP
jgi:hypothetical protein